MKPKLSAAAETLRSQVNKAFIDRDKTSDGWLGDTRHQARKSDHNPDENGWVRAIDIDRDLSGKPKPDLMPDLADQIRICAKSDSRIAYVIFAGRIASPKMGWKWRKYTGINAHNHHCHVSFTVAGDEDGSKFDIAMLGGKKK